MTWNASLPSNTTKIRNYPTILQDNFNSVEQGDLSLKYQALNIDERAGDPTRSDDTMIIFSKNDGSNTELYVMNDQNPADVIQMTKGTPNISPGGFSDNGETFIPGGLLLKYGNYLAVATTGTITFSSVGLTAFPNNLFNVLITNKTSSTTRIISAQNFSTTSFDFATNFVGNFCWMAIGN